jgi:nicotinamide riboside kinase
VKLCLTGPESTGKSTLAAQLADHLRLPLVTEQARVLMTPGATYGEALLRQLCVAQGQAEQGGASPLGQAVLDTDVLVIAVWWRVRFAPATDAPWPDWLEAALAARSPRYYLLCAPDLPWEPDPLRESQHEREALLDQYRALLELGPYDWHLVTGQGPARMRAALAKLPADIRAEIQAD